VILSIPSLLYSTYGRFTLGDDNELGGGLVAGGLGGLANLRHDMSV
jgi:hypothetical protein